VEIRTGETYNGHLVACDSHMNLHLREVVCTSRDGKRFWQMRECHIRGSAIKTVRIPEAVLEKVKQEHKEYLKEHGGDRERTYSAAGASGGDRSYGGGRGGYGYGRGGGPGGRGGYGRGDGGSSRGGGRGGSASGGSQYQRQDQQGEGSSYRGGRGGQHGPRGGGRGGSSSQGSDNRGGNRGPQRGGRGGGSAGAGSNADSR